MTGLEIFYLVAGIVLLVGAIVLVVMVLLQSNSSKGLSGTIAGGSETYFGKNKKKSIEKKLLIATIVVAITFCVLALVVFALTMNAETQETLYNELLEQIFGSNTNIQINGN